MVRLYEAQHKLPDVEDLEPIVSRQKAVDLQAQLIEVCLKPGEELE